MPKVVAYVSDLIFQTKIVSTGQALGVDVAAIGNRAVLRDRLTSESPSLVIIDLNAADDPIAALRLVREAENPPRTIAFVSHVQTELAEAARDAGADEVLPRSAFAAELPAILKGEPREG